MASSTLGARRESPTSPTARATRFCSPSETSTCSSPRRLKTSGIFWFSGASSDTMFTTLYPVNPTKVIQFPATLQDDKIPGGGNATEESAGSNHPGGANIAFCDGSVRFIKDSIQSWPINLATQLPNGITYNGTGVAANYTVAAGTQQGVYQSLSTRNGGEVISSDSY